MTNILTYGFYREVPSLRFLQAYVVLFLSIFGLLANSLIIFSNLVSNKRSVIGLVLASYVFLFPNIVVYLPCAFTGCHFYSPLMLNLLSTPDTVGYYCYQLSLTQLSIERVLIFYSEKTAKRMQKYVIHITAFFWLLISSQTIIEWFFYCRKSFNPQELYLYFDAIGTGEIFLTIHKIMSYGAPCIMALCYSAVFVRLRVLHWNMSSKKLINELILVFQYLFVCICSCLSSLCFFFLPQLRNFFQSNLSLLPTAASIISLTSHAYVFLLTNYKLRRAIIRFIIRALNLKSRPSVSDVTHYNYKSSVPIPVAK